MSSYVGWSYGPWSSGPIMTGIPLKEQQVMHPHHGTHGTQSKLTISGWIKGATGFLHPSSKAGRSMVYMYAYDILTHIPYAL